MSGDLKVNQDAEMTVAELIHALQQMPRDAVVYLVEPLLRDPESFCSTFFAKEVEVCGPDSVYISQDGAR